MYEVLFDHFLTRFQVLVILFLAGAVGSAIYWALRKRWQSNAVTMAQALVNCQEKMAGWESKAAALEQELADCQEESNGWRSKTKALELELKECDPERVRELYEQLQRFIAHEVDKPLRFIQNRSLQTLRGLKEGQNDLRGQQNKIVAKASELIQRADNIQELFAPEEDDPPKESLNMRRFVEGVSLQFDEYANSEGVTLLTKLADVDPTFLNRHQTSVVLGNVIHNAIKYSLHGGVVETTLSLEMGVLEGTEKAICIDVKDTGKGIPEDQQEKIFELGVRGNSLIEPGHGLGLFLARRAARRQGGDVILVRSSLNQGSVFRILLPYSGD